MITEAELRVIDQVAHGMSNEQAAKNLYLSVNTTKRHMHRAGERLGTSSRAGIVGACYRLGLLPVNRPAIVIFSPAPAQHKVRLTRDSGDWVAHDYALDDLMRVLGGTPIKVISAERKRAKR